MRRSVPYHLCPIVAAGLLIASVFCAAPAARADVPVYGVIPGTQHSPSVAVTPFQMYVLSFHRETLNTAEDYLKLAGSADGALTFKDIPLPTLPANWYWRPDGSITYDYGTGQVWMVGQARLVSTDSQIGLYIAAGFPQPDGSIAWFPPVLLWSQSGTTVFFPNVALAAGDGSGAAHVLFLDGYASRPGAVTLYRIQEDLGYVSMQNLAADEPAVANYTTPALAVSPTGDVMAGWAEVPAVTAWNPYPFVVRTSHNGGATFGSKEFITSLSFIENGPGATLRTAQLPTLLFAKYSPDFPQTRVAFWASPYAIGPQSDPSSIFVTTDCCDGSAWNPEPGTMIDRLPGSYELNPAVVMATDGYFYIGWHDFQPYDPDSVSRFMVSRVWNMGISASLPVPLADVTFDWDNVVSNQYGMGWASAAGELLGRVLFAWGDHRGDDPDVYARAFTAGGFALTAGCGDTVEVTAGQEATFAWRIENRNELFPDEYIYGASGTRVWTNGLEPDTVVIAPAGTTDVSFSVVVPDTAASGHVQMFAYAQDHVRITSCPMFLRVTALVDVAPNGHADGGVIALAAPRPNPASGGTALTFSLPSRAGVELAIYDLRGRRVATLAQGELGAGEHAARWDSGREAAGVYFVRLTVRTDAGVVTRERRLVVLR